ncbi:MAG: patatin-like phospholipase family protein [Planctomycetota bacterium]|jgi:NTE family protein
MTEPLTTVEKPVALVLGGGGARGVAHIGVFKALEEEQVPIDMIVGASIGAFGAALYGLKQDWTYLRGKTVEFLNSKGFKKYGKGLTEDVSGRKRRANPIKSFLMKGGALVLLAAKKSLVSHKKLRDAVDGLIPDKRFADSQVPLAIVALDLKSCEEVVIRHGPLREACALSANLAGFFPPQPHDGKLIVDPSPVSSVPVDAARSLGAAAVIAVDIRSKLEPVDGMASGVDAVFRVAAMASDRANETQIARADAVITPGVAGTYWSDFKDVDAHVEEGERAAREAMPEIRRVLAELGRA